MRGYQTSQSSKPTNDRNTHRNHCAELEVKTGSISRGEKRGRSDLAPFICLNNKAALGEAPAIFAELDRPMARLRLLRSQDCNQRSDI